MAHLGNKVGDGNGEPRLHAHGGKLAHPSLSCGRQYNGLLIQRKKCLGVGIVLDAIGLWRFVEC